MTRNDEKEQEITQKKGRKENFLVQKGLNVFFLVLFGTLVTGSSIIYYQDSQAQLYKCTMCTYMTFMDWGHFSTDNKTLKLGKISLKICLKKIFEKLKFACNKIR